MAIFGRDISRSRFFSSRKVYFFSVILVFGIVGGVIALMSSGAAPAITVDTSIAAPTNVRAFPNDRSLNVTWSRSNGSQVVGYYITYKKKGAASPENTRQTIHDSIQLQPLQNGQEYEITVQAAQGSYETADAGPMADNAPNATNVWARANGKVSAAVTATGTPSSARVDAMRSRLTGFFDDFNVPANPMDELKWNNASFCDGEKNSAGAFINTQFHAHNQTRCEFGGATSRPRAVFDMSVGINGGATSETNPAQIEYDMDLPIDHRRSRWYLDFTPLDRYKDNMTPDVTNHHDLFNEDSSDPGNFLRFTAGVYGMDFTYWDVNRQVRNISMGGCGGGDGCNMSNKTGNFSAGLPMQSNSLFFTAQNVRRHFVMQFTPTKMKVFVDNVQIANADIPPELFAAKRFTLQNTMFSYNTSKDFDGSQGLEPVYPYYHFYHWDNFGFSGPAPTTVIHNYIDGGQDGRTPGYLGNSGTNAANRNNRTSIFPIPDQIGSPIGGKAKLYMTLVPNWGTYRWKQGDHVVVNGNRYNVPDPVANMTNPPDGLLNPTEIQSVTLEINAAHLVSGNNTITFNMNGDGSVGWLPTNAAVVNAHIELEYSKSGPIPAYTQPVQTFGQALSNIVEPRLTNCDTYVFVEQDLGLPLHNGKANLETGQCALVAHAPHHEGYGTILDLRNFEAEEMEFTTPVTTGSDPNASRGEYITF